MRRALLVALAGLAIPALALGQAAGAVTIDSTTININQCNGTQNPPRGGDDELSLGMLWNLTFATVNSTPVTFSTGGKYRVWAGNARQSVDPKDAACEVPSSTVSNFQNGQVAEFDALVNPVTTKQLVSMKDIVTKAGFDCTLGATQTINLCVQWIESDGSTIGGWASGTSIRLDTTAPTNAPTNVHVSGGDGKLFVSCTGNDSASTSFKAAATPQAGGTTRYSDQDTSCSNLTITGLENNQPYDVVVYGMNDAFNPSPPSTPPQTGTPVPTEDFYNHYKQDGGRETGGCSTAAGAAGLLSVLALLAVRRRKS